MQVIHERRQYRDGFTVWYGKYPNMSFSAHWHEETELMYVRQGELVIHISDRVFTAREGDLLICTGANVHYSEGLTGKNCLEFINFGSEVLGIKSSLQDFFYPHITAEELQKRGLSKQVSDLFAAIPAELELRRPYYREIVKNMLGTFWYSVKRAFPEGEIPPKAQRHKQYMHYCLQKLLIYIEEHYREPLTLSDAASYVNFSESHISRLFCKYTGMGFVTYLNRIRVEKAVLQMQESPLRISDIALNCGFGSIRSFNRAFRSVTGCSPKEFCEKNEFQAFLFAHNPQKYSPIATVGDNSFVVMQNGKAICE